MVVSQTENFFSKGAENMNNVKKYILDQLAKKMISPEEATIMLSELKKNDKNGIHDIAIIGAGCRVPMAKNKEEFWDNLINGRVCLVSKPEDKLQFEEVYKNKSYAEFVGTRQALERDKNLENYIGAYIEDFDKFDAAFFGIPPREAAYIEPLQRVFMEVAWGAIEDAGYSVGNIRNTKTGVFVGRDATNHLDYGYITDNDAMKLSGIWEGILASRLSYLYNFRGPAMVIDTACSSGLVSIHEACNAIRNEECEMALAGGIAIGAGFAETFDKSEQEELQRENNEDASVLIAVSSSDSRVRTFDKKCSGTVFGEGVVVFLLKPLEAAERDHDNIYAVIKGSAINSDGASNGLTAPNPLAQEEVIVDAWKRAKVSPKTISYIESHGTATLLGDPIEIIGLTNAFSKFTDKKQFCGIGSLKTNIGHLVGASGTANLLKVMMSMNHHMLPPSLNFEEPNPHINFVDSPMYVVDKATKWQDENQPLCAGINSFGFSGTNCHVVVEEYKPKFKEAVFKKHKNIFTISAKTETAMKNLVKRYYDYIQDMNENNIDDICYTASTGRGHYGYRAAIIVDDIVDFKKKIQKFYENGLKTIEEHNIYFSKNHVVSDKRQEKAEGEITESELREITMKAQDTLHNVDKEMIFDNSEVLQDICHLYVKGADVDWNLIYTGKDTKRVPMPSYPFDRTPYWGKVKVTKLTEVENKQKHSGHALVQKCLADSMKESIYLVTLNLQKHWVIKDHKIMGSNLLPGTCYAEITKEAVSQCFHSELVEIESMVFLAPLVVAVEDGDLEIHAILEKEGEGVCVSIVSRHFDAYDHDVWVEHAKGKASIHGETAEKQPSLNSLLNSPRIKKLPLSTTFRNNEMNCFGSRWLCVQNFYEILEEEGNTIITEVNLPDEIKDDLKEYNLHPGMLDTALNMAAMQIYSSGDFYLPFSYKEFKIFRKLPAYFFSMVKRIPDEKESEVMRFHVILADKEGNTIATIKEITLKKINKINNYVNTSFYGVRWIPDDKVVEQVTKPLGNILIFKDQCGVSEKFSEKIQFAENTIYYVEPGSEFQKKDAYHYVVGASEEDYIRLLNSIGNKNYAMVLHFGTIDFKHPEPDSFKDEISNGLYSMLFLTKAFLKYVKGNVHFVLVSDNAHEVTGEEKYIKPWNASFLALAKTTTDECPNYTYKCIDFDNETDLDTIFAEALSVNGFRVAYRKNKRFGELLTAIDLKLDDKNSFKIRKKGTYVITGGTGGLGFEAALYLGEYSEQCNICLIGRREFPDRSKWNQILEDKQDENVCRIIEGIQTLEGRGSHIMVASADVSDYEAMSIIIKEVKNKYGKIDGVLHCAGVAGDGFLFNKTLETFNHVVEPKILGIKILDELTRDQELDFLIMYSSMQTIFGGAGQGDYTAGNAFLDAYAPYLWKKGIKAQTINWPGWSETGMAVAYGLKDTQMVFNALATQIGINALNSILFGSLSNVVPGKINFELLAKIGAENLPVRLADNLLKDLERYKIKSKAGVREEEKAMLTPEELLIIGKSEGYTETEKTVAYIYATVLNLQEIDVFENFNSMGGDSILAMTLLKAIDSKYPSIVDISNIFTYSTVEELSAFIDEKRIADEAAVADEKEADADAKLMEFLDDLEKGDTSIDDVLNRLGD